MSTVVYLKLAILLLSAFLIFAYHGNIGPNQCSKVSTNFNLDLQRLPGVWYLIASTPFNGNPVKTSCSAATKTLLHNSSILVNLQGYNKIGGPQTLLFNGVVTKQANGVEKFKINFPKHVTWPFFRYLDTNYATYDIVYGCEYLNGKYQGCVILILSRFCRLKESILREAENILKQYGINEKLITFGGPECCNESSSSSSASS